MEDLKQSVTFKDLKLQVVKVEIEIEQGRLSMCGEMGSSGGQCADSIKPKNREQKRLLEIWSQWHLNDMVAGCIHQEALGWQDKRINPSELPDATTNRDERGLLASWITESEHPHGLMCKPCPTCGYKYGTKWLKRELPGTLRDELINLCTNITHKEEQTKHAKGKLVKNLVGAELYDLIEEIDEEGVALALHHDLTLEEAINEVTSEQHWRTYEYGGTTYFIGTEEEAEEKARESLTEDPELWKQAVAAGDTTDSLEEWAQNVLDVDGVGSVLNSWDGTEEQQTVKGTTYLIIRQ